VSDGFGAWEKAKCRDTTIRTPSARIAPAAPARSSRPQVLALL